MMLADELGLGEIDQVAFVVRDMQSALPAYQSLFGPFTTRDVDIENLIFRSRKSRVSLRLAFGRSGGVEIELVQTLSGDSPQAEHLARHGEGLHHIRYSIADLETKQRLLETKGYNVLAVGERTGNRFAYLDKPETLGTTVIELIQWANAPSKA